MAKDEFGGLVCTLTDGQAEGTVRASNPEQAAADLLGAVDNVNAGATGECFWLRESGAYRWLIRREQDTAQVVVLWSAGTLTGWENVFWTRCEWQPLASALRTTIGALA
jgi:hypothetical protein